MILKTQSFSLYQKKTLKFLNILTYIFQLKITFKKLIQFSKFFSDEEESDPEDTELSRRGSMDSIISQESINRQNNNKKQQPEATQQETGSPSKWKKGHQRRHSLTVCCTHNAQHYGNTGCGVFKKGVPN